MYIDIFNITAQYPEKRIFGFRYEDCWGHRKNSHKFLLIFWPITSYRKKGCSSLAMCCYKDLLLFCLLDNVIDHRRDMVYFHFKPTVRTKQLLCHQNKIKIKMRTRTNPSASVNICCRAHCPAIRDILDLLI